MARRKYADEELLDLALHAAENAVRKFGVEKTRLVDVAKAIGVSHSLLYRVFPDRAALLEAVSNRWLAEIDEALAEVARAKKPARVRLIAWFVLLHKLKVRKGKTDRNLFSIYCGRDIEDSEAVRHHLDAMRGQLAAIFEAGIHNGEFEDVDPYKIANLFFEATLAYHHPALLVSGPMAERTKELTLLLNTLLDGVARGQPRRLAGL